MKYDRELIEQLAGQYVLGTLRGRARRRFERIMEQSPVAQSAVRQWEDRLLPLTQTITPVQPSAHVWRAIQARVQPQSTTRAEQSWWRGWPAALAAGVAALAVMLAWFNLQQREPGLTAVFSEAQQGELWRVEANKDHTEIRVVASELVRFDATRSYELWALPDTGGPPVSLGVIPARGSETRNLNERQRTALRSASKVAVSLEALGGSTTGAPGQVLHVTDVTRV